MRLLTTALFSIVLLANFSCSKEKKGTCESSYVNYQGYRLYTCEEDVKQYLCDNNSSSFQDAFYSDNRSCSSLGYGYQKSDGKWQYSDQDNVTPGANGKWGSGSGSSGGSSGTCSGSYKSPSSDAQLNAWCGAAYTYRCSYGKPLSDPNVKAVCEYYNNFREPGVQDCSYCK